LTLSSNIAGKLDSLSDAPFNTNYSLHVSNHLLKSIVDKVINCLIEWTLKLEEKGIVGENMTFNESESASAKEIPQQINYYGPVINGNINSSQIVSGSNNDINFNMDAVSSALEEIRKSLEKERVSHEEMETALEMLNDISEKLEQNKKPSIIKSALVGLKDFVLNTGSNVTAALIAAQIQGLF